MGVYLKVSSKDEIKFRQELMRDPKLCRIIKIMI